MELAHVLARGATAPIRLGLSAGGLGLSIARAVVDEARRALSHGDPTSAPDWRPATPPRADRGQPDLRGHGDPLAPVDQPPPAAPGPAVPAIPPRGAKRVDDEPVPVAEFAEPGAADGAGAEVHVDPPWDGYAGMTAAQIRRRLTDANRATAAAVSLHEGAGRKRRSVLDAADRRLRVLDSAAAKA